MRRSSATTKTSSSRSRNRRADAAPAAHVIPWPKGLIDSYYQLERAQELLDQARNGRPDMRECHLKTIWGYAAAAERSLRDLLDDPRLARRVGARLADLEVFVGEATAVAEALKQERCCEVIDLAAARDRRAS